MEPMKPEARARILAENPLAQPGDLEEYEMLLSRRFTIDPDLAPAPGERSEMEEVESRIAELHRKLFPEQHLEYSR
jgi:hypothetical protein